MLQVMFNRRTIRDWAVAALAVAAFGLAAFFWFHERGRPTVELTMTAGSPVEMRHQIAERLAAEATKHGLSIRVKGTVGSEEAYEEVNAGSLDLALVQGGLSHEDHPNVRQVTALNLEPLHLLVKEEIFDEVSKSLTAGLSGKKVNIGKVGSGTHWLAKDALEFAGLYPRSKNGGGDYLEMTLSQPELEQERNRDELPDAVFLVTTMPSRVARYLVSKQRYRIVPLPFGEAFALDALTPDAHPERRNGAGIDVEKIHVFDTVIPAFTYELEPEGVPPRAIHTLGTRLMCVANKDVDPQVVAKLLEVIFSTGFAQIGKPPIDPGLLDLPPELPLHAGTLRYLQRNKPLITGDVVDFLEKSTTIGGPLVGGAFFIWQWFRQRSRRKRDVGFEHYIFQVTEVERRALALEMGAMLELRELLRLQQELGQLKSEALARFVSGEIEGEELMSGFLTHVNDSRNYLARLILHERDNLEEEAQIQGRPLKALWSEALGASRATHATGADVDLPRPVPLGDHQNFQAPVEST